MSEILFETCIAQKIAEEVIKAGYEYGVAYSNYSRKDTAEARAELLIENKLSIFLKQQIVTKHFLGIFKYAQEQPQGKIAFVDVGKKVVHIYGQQYARVVNNILKNSNYATPETHFKWILKDDQPYIPHIQVHRK